MDKLLKIVDEVKTKIPFDKLAVDSANNKQSLFAEILDWLRDYYNQPKSTFFGVATYLLGFYAREKFLQDELEKTI